MSLVLVSFILGSLRSFIDRPVNIDVYHFRKRVVKKKHCMDFIQFSYPLRVGRSGFVEQLSDAAR